MDLFNLLQKAYLAQRTVALSTVEAAALVDFVKFGRDYLQKNPPVELRHAEAGGLVVTLSHGEVVAIAPVREQPEKPAAASYVSAAGLGNRPH